MNLTKSFPEHDSEKLRGENAPLAFRHACAPDGGGVQAAKNKGEILHWDRSHPSFAVCPTRRARGRKMQTHTSVTTLHSRKGLAERNKAPCRPLGSSVPKEPLAHKAILDERSNASILNPRRAVRCCYACTRKPTEQYVHFDIEYAADQKVWGAQLENPRRKFRCKSGKGRNDQKYSKGV